jgi:preprotein translocase subunit SecG
MSLLLTGLLVLQVVLAVLLVGLVLIQQGKGATAGAGFGGGASATVFGSQGSGSFITRMTAVIATFFLLNSLFLAYLYANNTQSGSLLDNVPVEDSSGSIDKVEIPGLGATNGVPVIPE